MEFFLKFRIFIILQAKKFLEKGVSEGYIEDYFVLRTIIFDERIAQYESRTYMQERHTHINNRIIHIIIKNKGI